MADSPSQTFAQRAIWPFARVLLAVGAASFALRASFSPAQTGHAALLLGIPIWAGAVAGCALALKFLSIGEELIRTLAAMWRPLALVLAGAFLLFFNDQGRELGVSLMIDNDGRLRFVLLFLALIYWGLNNWHTARLGIHGAVNNGDLGVVPTHTLPENPNRRVVCGYGRWLFWPPRLLGVCAHLFAAINLSLAAWHQPDFAHERLLAWTAPLAIVVFTGLVYVFDRYALSERTPGERSALARYGSLAGAASLLLAISVLAFKFHPQLTRLGALSVGDVHHQPVGLRIPDRRLRPAPACAARMRCVGAGPQGRRPQGGALPATLDGWPFHSRLRCLPARVVLGAVG